MTNGQPRTTRKLPLLLAILAVCVQVACSRTRPRPESTPPLADDFAAQASLAAAKADPEAGPPLTSDEQRAHLLSRVTFGATQGELADVRERGIAAFLEAQLHPDQLDDSLLDKRIDALPIMTHSAAELAQELEEFRREKKKGEEAAAKAAEEPQMDKIAREGKVVGKKDLGKLGRGPGFDYTVQLAEAKLLRASFSQKQLQEVMVDFWFNHFNVFAGKDREATLLPSYERDVIRANALGSFKELLSATAHSPAMLIYLDNWRSSGSPEMVEQPRNKKGQRLPNKGKKGNAGLNENYARELLELHTLGVDGGYTQTDVTEVARCFTGWSVAEPKEDPRFLFRAKQHDLGEKRVLGHVIEAGGGMSDGEQVLEILLAHPSTGRFLARKLARRFISDDPPDAVVERMAAVYAQTEGDIRAMLRTMFSSPEFWSRRALKAKMRSPLELVEGSVRALGADVQEPVTLVRQIARIGEPLYAAVPPTGYGDVEETWASSGAILSRIDFALALTKGDLPGVHVDLAPLAVGSKSHGEVLERAAQLLGAGTLTERTRTYALAQLTQLPLDKKPAMVAQRAVGLLLGAPELQRR